MHHSIFGVTGFKVGAALLCRDGQVFTGANIENPSITLTMCAERVALYKALSEGQRRFQAIAVVSSGKNPCYPCGLCRQLLYEFAPDLNVLLDSSDGIITVSLTELLPEPFAGPDVMHGA